MLFQSESAVFKLLQRTVDEALENVKCFWDTYSLVTEPHILEFLGSQKLAVAKDIRMIGNVWKSASSPTEDKTIFIF